MKKTAEEILKAEFVDGEWEELMSYMNTDITPSIVGAMEKLADQFKPKWIPSAERLPEVNEWVIVFFMSRLSNEPVHKVDEYLGNEWRHTDSGVITHWMPLPAAPERKEVGE